KRQRLVHVPIRIGQLDVEVVDRRRLRHKWSVSAESAPRANGDDRATVSHGDAEQRKNNGTSTASTRRREAAACARRPAASNLHFDPSLLTTVPPRLCATRSLRPPRLPESGELDAILVLNPPIQAIQL